MTNTSKKTIEGIKFIARDTQKTKVFDKVAYTFKSNAVINLLYETNNYQNRYMKEFDIYDKARIKYGQIDTEALRDKAIRLAKQNDDDENETYHNLVDETIEKVNPPYSKIMECILDEIGYYHEVQLYDGSEWFDESEIDIIDYDEGMKGTFTLKEDEE